jgi:benzoate-CoA ligase family protein
MSEEIARYNAAGDLLGRNIGPGRADRTAVIDRDGHHTYADVAAAANRFANLLARLGIHQEARILMALEDSAAFHACFLGAMKAGIVPVPVNTLLTADDYAFIAADCRARLVVASSAQAERMQSIAARVPAFVDRGRVGTFAPLRDALAQESPQADTADTRRDEPAFWLYTSGTTGRPKGAIHAHGDLAATAETYGAGVLGIRSDDVVFSAAKLFFAYGLGNSLTFPFSVGATVVLLDGPPAATAVKDILDRHRPTLFFGVPTLYAMLLNARALPAAGHRLRQAVSAGEALPATLLDRWRAEVGTDILDGIGSTEMLHIYISNRPGDVRAGTSGRPVPGYHVEIRDDSGDALPDGEIGDLYVKGPSMALGYWNRRTTTMATFRGEWMRTGDKYRVDDGRYVYCGRGDDLLKVGGIYVSPMEVEDALLRHPGVAEAAVVGAHDGDDLVKPKAFVVPATGHAPSPALEETLIEHVRETLAPYKRPRWVEFVTSLPKTATGKIQRYKLRQ